ncbi:hypothetical protein, partial [Escherichia coli]|uniref:hypothetical protein n=2 Tax=Escherichia coli TaxID=562 RepID=UPI001F49D0DF
ADRNRSHWSTSKTPSYTKSVSWQHHLSRLVRKTYRSNQRRARRMTVWCFLIAENGDLKENKIFFCVDNSVFTWVLILWYELKKKNTTRG